MSCHLWTAKRANLGFSLIATVTSLLRLRWGWVEGRHGRRTTGGWRDGGMKTQLSSHTRPRCERTRQANRMQPGGVRRQGVGRGTACAVKKPQHPAEREDSALASFWSLNFDGEMTTLGWIIVGHFSDTDTCYFPPT